MRKRKRILVISDLDDTLFETVSEALQRIYEITGKLIDFSDIVSYDIAKLIHKTLGMSYPDASIFMKESIWTDPKVYLQARPSYYTWHALQTIRKNNLADIIFLTSRPESLMSITIEKVEEIGFPSPNIIFGSMNEKAQIISQLQADKNYHGVIVLEDCADIEMELNRAGFFPIILDKPWTKESKPIKGKDLLKGILECIEDIKNS